jgi:hypothetical protein
VSFIAALLTKFATWLGGRGLRHLVRELYDALEQAEFERDYQLAMTELALAEKSAEAERLAKEVRNEVEALPDDVLRERAAGWVRGAKRPGKTTSDRRD